jgi:hypothetical protein
LGLRCFQPLSVWRVATRSALSDNRSTSGAEWMFLSYLSILPLRQKHLQQI